MAIEISQPLVEEKALSIDPSGETVVRVRQARHKEELRRAQEMFSPAELPFEGLIAEITETLQEPAKEEPPEWVGGLSVKIFDLINQVMDFNSGVTVAELHVLEVWLTFEHANILKDGEEMFGPSAKKSWLEFKRLFGLLPSPVADSWIRAMLEVNPDWDFLRRASEKPEGGESE